MITVRMISYRIVKKKKKSEALWPVVAVALVAITRFRVTAHPMIARNRTLVCATIAAARWRRAKAITSLGILASAVPWARLQKMMLTVKCSAGLESRERATKRMRKHLTPSNTPKMVSTRAREPITTSVIYRLREAKTQASFPRILCVKRLGILTTSLNWWIRTTSKFKNKCRRVINSRAKSASTLPMGVRTLRRYQKSWVPRSSSPLANKIPSQILI